MEFHIFTLPNGVRAILKRVKSEVVHCALSVNAGSRDEMPHEHGAAHFAEHMFFKGTERRNASYINSRLENLGGELNAYTTKEETVVHASTLKGDFAKALELIADIAFNSTFDAKELAKEREIIYDEINLYKDSPSDMIFDDFEDMIFSDSSLGHNILGKKATLKKLDVNAIKSFLSRTYTTDNIVVSAIGNITPAKFEQVVAHCFAGLPASTRNCQRTVSQSDMAFMRCISKNRFQAHCIMGTTAYSLFDARRINLSLLINVLGGPSANSILNSVVRERHGLTYNIEAAYTPFCDTGLMTIYFGADKDNVDRCIELIERELKTLREKGLSSRRLSIAKRQLIGQFSIGMENNESYMLGAGKSLLVYNAVDAPSAIFTKVDEITNADIIETANDIFHDISTLIYK